MTDDWFDFMAALLDAGTRFLVVGAHAMAVHGVVRGTQDLDLLTSLSGVPSFDAAWGDREVHDIRARDVPFLGWDTLVANKRAVDRTKDLADLEALGE